MIQQKVIDWILFPFIKISQHMSEKAKNVLFVGSATVMIARSFFSGMLTSWPYFLLYLFSVVCMIGMIIATVNPHMRPVRFCKFPMACWLLVGGIMLATTLVFNDDWFSESVLFLVICPILFIVWGGMDHKKLIRLFLWSIITSFGVYFIGCCIFAPIEEWQYAGLYANPNGTALYLVLVFAALSIEVYLSHVKKWVYLLYLPVLGLCAGLLFYTGSRTGQYSAVISYVLVVGFALVRDFKVLKWKILLKFVCCAVAIVAMLPTTLYVVRAGNTVLGGVETYNWRQMLLNSEDSFESLFGSDGDGNAFEITADSITTGRVSIWKEYLKHSTWYGSGQQEKFWVESRHMNYTTAHMTLVTYAFRHGYVCAALFLLFAVVMGIRALIFAWKRKGDYFALFPLMISLIFGMAFLFESMNTPFSHMLTIFYYFVQAPLLVSFGSKKKQEAMVQENFENVLEK
ncbi:MAG: O-antigen ligase family protein [Clostridia bacterium]|nr:O-antigen ligase family protein [Clostridia bacterium]